eukprot:CFRG5722T1
MPNKRVCSRSTSLRVVVRSYVKWKVKGRESEASLSKTRHYSRVRTSVNKISEKMMDEDDSQDEKMNRKRSRSPLESHGFRNNLRDDDREGTDRDRDRDRGNKDTHHTNDDYTNSDRQHNRGNEGSGGKNNKSSADDVVVLHVTALNPSTRDADLEEAFAAYGQVKSARIMRDPHTQESRGFGFVTMGSTEAAETCISKLNSSTLNGKQIVVAKARRARAHSPTPGKYRGHKAGDPIHRTGRDHGRSFTSASAARSIPLPVAPISDVADPMYRKAMIDFHTKELNRLYDYERETERRDSYREPDHYRERRYSARDVGRDMGGRGGSGIGGGLPMRSSNDSYDRRSVVDPVIYPIRDSARLPLGGGDYRGSSSGRVRGSDERMYYAGSGGGARIDRGDPRDRDHRVGGGRSRDRSRTPYR